MKNFASGVKTFLESISPLLPYIFGAGVILIAGYFLWGKVSSALGIGGADGETQAQLNDPSLANNPATAGSHGLLGGATPQLAGTYSQAAAEVILHPLDSIGSILGWGN